MRKFEEIRVNLSSKLISVSQKNQQENSWDFFLSALKKKKQINYQGVSMKNQIYFYKEIL